jgi:Zn-dependent M16 (insulinase) family peptidase
VDSYATPESKGDRALNRFISKLSPEKVQQRWEELLNTNEKDIVAFGELLKELMPQSSLCVAGSQQIINSAQEKSKGGDKTLFFEQITQTK